MSSPARFNMTRLRLELAATRVALSHLVEEFDRVNAARPDGEKLGDTPAIVEARVLLGEKR